MRIEQLFFKKKTGGFSLVEVNLAVMLVALGLLVLFSLFPAGLNQGERAHSDTQSALFANYVLSTIRANASEMDWADWSGNDFRKKLCDGSGVSDDGTPTIHSAKFPAGSENYVKYMLAIDDVPSTALLGVNLWVWGGQYGPTDVEIFKNRAKWFYTELFYSGMP